MSASLQSLMRDQLSADEAGSPVLLRLLAFVVIGGAGAVAFVSISAAAVSVFDRLPAWLVSSLCYACFIVPVYLLHRRYSFPSRAGHARALPRYVAVQLASLALAAVFSFIAYDAAALPTLAAAIVVTVLTSGINFVVLRRWAFAEGA